MGKYWIGKKRTPAGVEHELKRFQSSRKAKKDRAARNKARREALREGRVHRGDNKEVDHRDRILLTIVALTSVWCLVSLTVVAKKILVVEEVGVIGVAGVYE